MEFLEPDIQATILVWLLVSVEIPIEVEKPPHSKLIFYDDTKFFQPRNSNYFCLYSLFTLILIISIKILRKRIKNHLN